MKKTMQIFIRYSSGRGSRQIRYFRTRWSCQISAFSVASGNHSLAVIEVQIRRQWAVKYGAQCNLGAHHQALSVYHCQKKLKSRWEVLVATSPSANGVGRINEVTLCRVWYTEMGDRIGM